MSRMFLRHSVFCLFIRHKLQTTLCPKKTSPTFFDSNLKTNYQMLIIFGTNIPDTTCQLSFLFYPMYASALPRESRSSEICVEITEKREKNIPDVIDRNLKKDQQILIIYGRNISDTTGYFSSYGQTYSYVRNISAINY